MPIGCATAPATVAGIAALANATSQHTLAHVGEVWQPVVLDRRSSWDDWLAKGRPPPDHRARQLVRDFLSPHDHHPVRRRERRRGRARPEATHFQSGYEPEPLACGERIREIVAAYERM